MTRFGKDLRAFRQRDPACKNVFEVIFLYSGFHALMFHRLAHFLYKCHLFFLARFVSQLSRFLTGIEIHPGAKIGRGVFIDHGSGIVIGETAEVGDNCTIYQGVTLGGTGKDTGKRHPTLGNDVLVGAGAKVLGPLTVGDHAKIAAGAVVLRNIPEHATAVGVPAKVVRIAGNPSNDQLDQVHIPDPVALELDRLRQQVQTLQSRLDELEKNRQK
ncbi:MAG: serine O-acetyltransferase [Clostridia bacterium]|nr:serine O-acetyltransferase [Clostridia bacterium]